MPREYELHSPPPTPQLRIDYAKELNEQQFTAVTALPGPALVIAGAGSGKTRALTYRVAYLLEQGIPPDRILLLTFTNKAAKEMMRRVAELLRGDWSALWGGTFHSVGMRVLRRHADRVGYRANFLILDREDATDVIKSCLADEQIDTRGGLFPNANVLGEIFSNAANAQKPVRQVLEEDFDFFDDTMARIEKLAKRYAERKRSANSMDFDDLVALWLELLKQHADIRDQYQRRFQFILVDEYQDTNLLQSQLIDLLGAQHRNVMVVGDDAQSIYSWRGAHFRNIFAFPERYPNTSVYKIETNYRSTPEILGLANLVIAGNKNQFGKRLVSARSHGLRPALIPCDDAGVQALFVAQRLRDLEGEGVPWDQMAVLYRSHFHALELQLELTRLQIPFSITSGMRFFEQAHIKDVAAYLKFVTNPTDELSFSRLVRLIPGIGPKMATKLWQKFNSAFQGEIKGTDEPPTAPGPIPNGEAELLPPQPAFSPTEGEANGMPGSVPAPDGPGELAGTESGVSGALPSVLPGLHACDKIAGKKEGWNDFVELIEQMEESESDTPGDLIRLVLESGYADHLQEHYTNHKRRLEDLEQLADFSLQFASTHEFLSQLALLTNLEAEDEKPSPKDEAKVRLSTVHQAKGLEFQAVFLVMLCDGLFPSTQSLDDLERLEEERRLFYVAVTRAKDQLYLLYPRRRFLASTGGERFYVPSRFVADIPRNLVEEWNLNRSFTPRRW